MLICRFKNLVLLKALVRWSLLNMSDNTYVINANLGKNGNCKNDSSNYDYNQNYLKDKKYITLLNIILRYIYSVELWEKGSTNNLK